jgi:FkbM family methyltransferase
MEEMLRVGEVGFHAPSFPMARSRPVQYYLRMERIRLLPSVIALLASAVLIAGPVGAADTERPSLDEFMAGKESHYGHGQEELLIRHFFRDRRDGVYLDIGCFDYKKWSTTYYLEKHLGWTGIGVDADDQYRGGWEEHRPKSKFVAYAVTDKSGETIKFHLAGGLSATEADTKNLEMWKEKKKFKTVAVEVPTITMNDLLEREGIEKIDFLSMDINGAEPVALAGFDIERYSPALVHVEASPHRHDDLRAYFEKHNYVRIEEYAKHDKTNWYMTPASPKPE